VVRNVVETEGKRSAGRPPARNKHESHPQRDGAKAKNPFAQLSHRI
jgi:hypothetical protein